jgi:hypothetical protein
VTYVPIGEEKVHIVFVDDDADGIEVTPTPDAVILLSGLPGETVEYTQTTAQQGVPEGYVFNTLDAVDVFDNNPAVDQTITVHLVHQHTQGALEVNRVIHYRGAGVKTPADVTQTIEWVSDTDAVNAVTLYSSEVGFTAVDSPAIGGYSVDVPQVPATNGATNTTTQPTNTEITVTYTAIPTQTQPLPITGPGHGVTMAAYGAILGLGLGVFFVVAARRRKREQA